MAQTRQTIETFSTAAVRNSAAPGNLGAFSAGSLQPRALGPTSSGLGITGAGRRAVTGQANFRHYWDVSSASTFKIAGWLKVLDFGGSDGGHCCYFCQLATSSDGFVCNIGFQGNGKIEADDPGASTISASLFPLATWCYVEVAVNMNIGAGFKLSYTLWVTPVGGSRTAYITRTNVSTGGPVPQRAGFCNIKSGSPNYWAGGLAMLEWDTLGALGDAALPGDITAPVAGPARWYLSDLGNDANDGITPSTPIQSCALLNTLLSDGTISGGPNPWTWADTGNPVPLGLSPFLYESWLKSGQIKSGGDSVIFQGATKNHDASIFQASFAASGIEFTSDGFCTLDNSKQISGFIQYNAGTYPNVWQTSDTSTACTLWENGLWLYHVAGSSLTSAATISGAGFSTGSYADVRTAINSKAGSWWTNGSTLYFSTSDGSNPNTNGKTYRRSRAYNSGVDSMLTLRCSAHVHHLAFSNSTSIDNSNNSISNGYGIEANDNIGQSVIILHDVIATRNGKHGIGQVLWNSNSVFVCYNYAVGDPSPSLNGGTYFACVNFSSTTGITGATALWRHGKFTGVGTVLSPAMQAFDGLDAQYAHNNATSDQQFKLIALLDCDYSLGGVSDGNSVVVRWLMERTSARAIEMTSAMDVLECSTTSRHIKTSALSSVVPYSDFSLIGRCQINFSAVFGTGLTTLAGKMAFVDCEFDASGATMGTNNVGLFRDSTDSSVLFERCSFKMPTSAHTPVVFDGWATNLSTHGNVYLLDTTANQIAINFNGNTSPLGFAAWQGLGQDVASQPTAELGALSPLNPFGGNSRGSTFLKRDR